MFTLELVEANICVANEEIKKNPAKTDIIPPNDLNFLKVAYYCDVSSCK
jgi:hypothetical protein